MSESQDLSPPVDPVALAKARRGRNIALALGLVAFIVIVYGVTLIRMGGYVASRPL
jgi:hypothetical protein